MKKLIIALLAVATLASCASSRGVGDTRMAAKSKRFNSGRVGTQFNSVR